MIHSGDKVVGTANPMVGSCLYVTVEARAEFWLEVNENNDLIFFHLNLLALGILSMDFWSSMTLG